MSVESLHYFQMLGEQIERQWLASGYNEDVFTALAHDALVANPPHLNVSARDIVDSVFEPTQPFRQPNSSEIFGEPPVTLFQAPRFYIEAIFWFSSTTSIHEHAFSGAFAVLTGSSVHSHWRFTMSRAINSRMVAGRLDPQSTEVLRPGGVRPIYSGDRLIHQLFHLEVPSVTIVVRTYLDRHQLPQYRYLLPGLALDSTDSDGNRIRRLMLLEAMASGQFTGLEKYSRHLIDRADVESIYYLFSMLTRRKIDADLLTSLWAAARQRHGEIIDLFQKICAWERRERLVTGLRAKVTEPNARLLLALLMLLPNRATLLEAVQNQNPESEPLATIESWLENMSKDTIGFVFDATNRTLFRELVLGRTQEQMLDSLKESFETQSIEENRQKLLDHAAQMARSTLFWPLFSESPLRPPS